MIACQFVGSNLDDDLRSAPSSREDAVVRSQANGRSTQRFDANELACVGVPKSLGCRRELARNGAHLSLDRPSSMPLADGGLVGPLREDLVNRLWPSVRRDQRCRRYAEDT